MATETTDRLRGKHKPEATAQVATCDYIVELNAQQVQVTVKEVRDKIYYHHTGYVGGIKAISFQDLIEKAPERTIQKAVKGMMPKGPLGRAMLSKLKVYAGSEHPHTAQQPQELKI